MVQRSSERNLDNQRQHRCHPQDTVCEPLAATCDECVSRVWAYPAIRLAERKPARWQQLRCMEAAHPCLSQARRAGQESPGRNPAHTASRANRKVESWRLSGGAWSGWWRTTIRRMAASHWHLAEHLVAIKEMQMAIFNMHCEVENKILSLPRQCRRYGTISWCRSWNAMERSPWASLLQSWKPKTQR